MRNCFRKKYKLHTESKQNNGLSILVTEELLLQEGHCVFPSAKKLLSQMLNNGKHLLQSPIREEKIDIRG